MTPLHSRFGTVFGLAILIAIGRLIVTAWLVEPYVVTSGSMAPALLGVHCHVKCPECNREFDIGLDTPAGTLQRAICPECGARGAVIEDQPVLAGDRVWIDKSVFTYRQPQRWEVVAFRSPATSSQVHVKRVVGLPGETVEIKGGEVYIDGIISKRTVETHGVLSDNDNAPLSDADGYNQTRSLREAHRGIYYTVPPGLTGALGIDYPYKLGPEGSQEYFVLGDNSQLAVDSRYPLFGPIDAKLLVGKPIGIK